MAFECYILCEINCRIRGRLGSLLMLSVCSGILCGFIAGTYFGYYLVPKIFLPLPIVFFGLFIFFPETPQYFITRKHFEVTNRSKQYKTNKQILVNSKLAFSHSNKISLFLSFFFVVVVNRKQNIH